MNVELLLRVKAHILEEPKRVYMGVWMLRYDFESYGLKEPNCGTVGCIQGWAKIFVPSVNPLKLDRLGQDRLFYVNGWPGTFRTRLHAAPKQSPEYAQVVADRIDHFIATDGRE